MTYIPVPTSSNLFPLVNPYVTLLPAVVVVARRLARAAWLSQWRGSSCTTLSNTSSAIYRERLITWGCSWTSFNSRSWNSVGPMSTFLWFSESLERDLSNEVFLNPKFCWGHNLSFSALDHGLFIIHGTVKLTNTLKGLFLSFQKINVDIGSTV